MLIYEVNLDVDDAVAGAYGAWLGEHIRAMLQLDGFRSAALYERTDEAEAGRRRWTVHYHVESRDHLDAYLGEHAERMRGEGTERFEGRFSAERRVLAQREVFSRVIGEE